MASIPVQGKLSVIAISFSIEKRVTGFAVATAEVSLLRHYQLLPNLF